MLASVNTKSTAPLPSNATFGAVASPLALKLRDVASTVALAAVPVKLPTNVDALTVSAPNDHTFDGV